MSGSIKPEDITLWALDARGLVALYCTKRDLLLPILHFELDRVAMDPSTKAGFKDVMGPFASYRLRLIPPSAAAATTMAGARFCTIRRGHM